MLSGTSAPIDADPFAAAEPDNHGALGAMTLARAEGEGATDAATLGAAQAKPDSISGFVYVDLNNDGVRDLSETGVPGVQITLLGNGESASPINRTTLTDDSGHYVFEGLPAGTYSVLEQHPLAMADGRDTTAAVGAVVGDDRISGLVLSEGQSLTENNFGEAGLLPEFVHLVWFFASSRLRQATLCRETVAMAEEKAGRGDLAEAIRSGNESVPHDDNAPPVAQGDSYVVAQDQVLTVNALGGVLANDTDGDGDALTATLAGDASHGSIVLESNGAITYTPNANFSGTDTFRYRASDGVASSNEATVTITVTPGNRAPQAASDQYDVAEDTTLVVDAATGVLANDTDPDGDALTATLVAAASHGSVVLESNGAFTYTPNANFHGSDQFTYVANDGVAVSQIATVSLTISPVNDRPYAASDSYVTPQGVPLIVDAASGVLANDSDADGDALTASLVSGTAHGTLELNPDGSFTYTPNAGAYGFDSFTYRASDGTEFSADATVVLGVTKVDLARLRLVTTSPQGTPLTSISEDQPFLVNVYATDLRAEPQGVFAAYLDLLYDSALVVLNGSPLFGTTFSGNRRYDTSVPGIIDEMGALTSGMSAPAESLLVAIPFIANAVGTAQFRAEPPDTMGTELLLFGRGSEVPESQVIWDTALLEITAKVPDG